MQYYLMFSLIIFIVVLLTSYATIVHEDLTEAFKRK
jgi:hypothetical protein